MTAGLQMRLGCCMAMAALYWVGAARLALAAEVEIVVPARVIYPRDIITGDMLRIERRTIPDGAESSVLRDPAKAIGKEATRTLVAGGVIHASELAEPIIVRQGGSVEIRFTAYGISIAVSGTALQSGAAGNVIRVRNADSGAIITAAIVSPGAVEVRRE